MNIPLVSVVIPTFNRAKLLPRAIGSALRQTYKNLEVLVVDDCSSDETADVVRAIASENANVFYIRREFTGGGGAARNTGVAAAKGVVVAFLDSDDEWVDSKISIQIDALQSLNTVGVCVSGVNWVFEDGRIITKSPRLGSNVFQSYLRNTVGCKTCSGMVLYRELICSINGFDESMPASQDLDLYLRLAKKCQFVSVPEALVNHYFHGNRITANTAAKIEARQKILKKYNQDFQKDIIAHVGLLRELAGLLWSTGQRVLASRCLWEAIQLKPISVAPYVEFLFYLLVPYKVSAWR